MRKDLGATLLVAGTTIGAGMLALPTITFSLGLGWTFAVYLATYALMFLSAKQVIKLTLHYKPTPNFVTLAKNTLGAKGEGLCWILYLLLMYALLAAYISASSSMILPFFPVPYLAETLALIFLPVVFGLFLTFGMRGIDHFNRLLMLLLISSFALLCYYLGQKAHLPLVFAGQFRGITLALPVIMTSFGYHIIIPTLTDYLDRNYKRILRAVFLGSLIPLGVYLFWQILVELNLSQIELSDCLLSDIPLTEKLAKVNPQFTLAAASFAFVAIITSFLGVSISLYDFLKDSLPKHRLIQNRQILFSLTFIPPLVYIFYFKKAFYLALDHAGILVALLLILLPALMYRKIKKDNPKTVFILIISAALVIIGQVMQHALG